MSETRIRIQPARRVAYEVISAVRESDAYANLLLPVRLDRAKLSGQDAALATELAYGTLRMLGYYDRVIELAARRPGAQVAARHGDHRTPRAGQPARSTPRSSTC